MGVLDRLAEAKAEAQGDFHELGPKPSSSSSSAAEADLVGVVSDFLFEDASFTERLEAWCEFRCASFEDGSAEHRLEHTELHAEFRGLFEGEIERAVRSRGGTVAALYSQLERRAHERGSREEFIVLAILSTVDFETFARMMRETRRSRGTAERNRK